MRRRLVRQAEGAGEFFLLAEVVDGQLISLENGRSRKELFGQLITITRHQPQTVIGLDFAFSFPRRWCAEQGWRICERSGARPGSGLSHAR